MVIRKVYIRSAVLNHDILTNFDMKARVVSSEPLR